MHRSGLLILGLLSARVPAQVTFTATTWTALQVSATGGTPASVPANTPLTGTVAIGSIGSSPTFAANAFTRVVVDTSLPLQPSLRIEDQADATSTGLLTTAGGTCGLLQSIFPIHEVLVRVSASTPVHGAFEIDYQLSTAGSGQVGMLIDLGNDGTNDVWSFGQPLLARIPVAFGPGTSVLRTRTGVNAWVNPSTPPHASASQVLVVRFVPDPGCSVVTVAPPCGMGPWLTTRPNFLRGVDLHAATIFPPNGIGGLVVGMSQQSTTLPLPPGCLLHTDVLAWQPVQATASGTFDLTLDLRRLLRPTMFRMQMLWWDPGSSRLLTSDTLQVSCQ